jgi:hypothetical protein
MVVSVAAVVVVVVAVVGAKVEVRNRPHSLG